MILHDMFIIDLGGHTLNVEWLKIRFPHAKVTRYNHTHLATIDRCIKHCRTERAWIVFSCCDYSQFDFGWEPAPWESSQVHCWASGTQKYGDTFLIPKKEWLKQWPFELLEWYRDINYHTNGVPRLAWPMTRYDNTDLVSAVKKTDFQSLYHWFIPVGTTTTGTGSDPALWTEKHHQLVSFSDDNSVNLVPRTAKTYLVKQVYDYPYLHRTAQVYRPQQDIVFISYDETQADEQWANLISQYPDAQRVHGVEGMENALRRAAEISKTAWFYAVFAKTRLHEDWDFSYKPDWWQGAKNYIFYAKNMSNDLVYGEMGVVMYHRESVLNSPPFEELDIDFTMSFDVAVIPRMSAYGEFATDPYRAWRTAFRECVKLAKWNVEKPCVETAYRLYVWQTHAHGEHAEWVLRGARDGAVYYAAFKNRHDVRDALKKTFRWDWLRDHYTSLYPQTLEHKTLP